MLSNHTYLHYGYHKVLKYTWEVTFDSRFQWISIEMLVCDADISDFFVVTRAQDFDQSLFICAGSLDGVMNFAGHVICPRGDQSYDQSLKVST